MHQIACVSREFGGHGDAFVGQNGMFNLLGPQAACAAILMTVNFQRCSHRVKGLELGGFAIKAEEGLARGGGGA